MKLLDTSSGNTKIAKTNNKNSGVRVASLSLMPTDSLCPASKAAGCRTDCLVAQGRGRFDNVKKARQAKTDWLVADTFAFLAQLNKELDNFEKLCKRQGVKPICRLNVLSDVAWEDLGVMDKHPNIMFYDYTKRAKRLNNLPPNYKLIFSFSGKKSFGHNALEGLRSDAPVAVVFRGQLPEFFAGRRVIDGDQDDWLNVHSGRVVVGLKAKGSAKHDTSGFVVDSDNIIAFGG
jgi:hypothetical protein